MQTFLPYASFPDCARCLDYRRLGKQRIEAWQIWRILSGFAGGWRSHPAVKMWRGHEAALKAYYNAVRAEWIARGYKNTMPPLESEPWSIPDWITDDLIRSHRSNLMRKDPVWYGQFAWNVPDNLAYVWPKGMGS